MDDLLSDFLTETNESLGELDVALITLERTPDDAETLSFIFRLVHTIKGTCGFLGLPRLERVAHAGENILGKLRDRSLTVTPDIVTQVLSAIDQIKAIVTCLGATGAEPAGDDAELIAALNLTAANGIRSASTNRRRSNSISSPLRLKRLSKRSRRSGRKPPPRQPAPNLPLLRPPRRRPPHLPLR
ncbi:MAG TPA: Hpt domain-containing protein, partial [Rhodopila sp.]